MPADSVIAGFGTHRAWRDYRWRRKPRALRENAPAVARHDVEWINANAERLNAEVEETLEFQADWGLKNGSLCRFAS